MDPKGPKEEECVGNKNNIIKFRAHIKFGGWCRRIIHVRTSNVAHRRWCERVAAGVDWHNGVSLRVSSAE